MGDRLVSHNLDVVTKTCSCGKWQEYEYPCIDAVAYLREEMGRSVEDILEQDVPLFYDYAYLQSLYKDNLNPVAISVLQNDGSTLPPHMLKQPKMKPRKIRIRKRCKFVDPNESTIKCSICGERGHNKKTCYARKLFQASINRNRTSTLIDSNPTSQNVGGDNSLTEQKNVTIGFFTFGSETLE